MGIDGDVSVRFPSISPNNRPRRHEQALSSYRLVDFSMDKVVYKGQKHNYLCK